MARSAGPVDDEESANYHAFMMPTSQRSARGYLSSWRVALALVLATAFASFVFHSQSSAAASPHSEWLAEHRLYVSTANLNAAAVKWRPPATNTTDERCHLIIDLMTARDEGSSWELRHNKYTSQSTDANGFYRATAKIFWRDFVLNGWGNFNLEELGGAGPNALADNSPLEPKSTWTWITGDQHLSNFGAWRNRHGDVVFGVNDFDEAAVYDFQIDVWRLAVSIHNHAHTNGLNEKQADEIVMFFCDEYVRRLQEYVGNEVGELFEITPAIATGKLLDFLEEVSSEESSHKQLQRFTYVDEASNERRLLKNEYTSLEAIDADLEQEIRRAFGALTYGATRNKVGWRAKAWSDSYFRVLDIGRRVGSGVGSYGVPRYYVLLAGADEVGPAQAAEEEALAAAEDDEDDSGVDGGGEYGNRRRVEDGNRRRMERVPGGVILDVKYEPATSAVAAVLNEHDTAWYSTIFSHDAMRTVEAQRRLTSYTDPFAGWVVIDGLAHVVRATSYPAPRINARTGARRRAHMRLAVSVSGRPCACHIFTWLGTAASPGLVQRPYLACYSGLTWLATAASPGLVQRTYRYTDLPSHLH